MDTKQEIDTQKISIQGEEWLLLPEKAVFWKKRSMLILTDLHLGKAGHFRKAGIPIPSGVHQADLACLQKLITKYQPQKILILGDLFHSELNSEWQQFRYFLEQHSRYQFTLVKGNHDVLPKDAYHEPNLEVYEEIWEVPPFRFTHHPSEAPMKDELYTVCGHIHPGYKVKIRAGQSVKLPCFFLSKAQAILPAFGKFTGCVHMPRQVNDRVFVIIPEDKESGKVMEIRH